MLGLAWAGAAYAKLTNGGLAWLTGGAVRYHFVNDGLNAPSGLGGLIAADETLSILMSAGAVLAEATFITVLFTVSPWKRLAYGVIACLLLAGFWAFQNVRWPLWWCLLPAFLPLQLLDRQAHPTTARPGMAFGYVALLIAALQVWASWGRREREPFYSNFPMYSGTYPSLASFTEELSADRSSRIRLIDGTRDLTDAVRDIPRGYQVLEAVINGRATDRERSQAVAVFNELGRHDQAPADLRVLRSRARFNWESGRFEWIEEDRFVARVRCDAPCRTARVE